MVFSVVLTVLLMPTYVLLISGPTYTVKKVADFPLVPSWDVTNQNLPGGA